MPEPIDLLQRTIRRSSRPRITLAAICDAASHCRSTALDGNRTLLKVSQYVTSTTNTQG